MSQSGFVQIAVCGSSNSSISSFFPVNLSPQNSKSKLESKFLASNNIRRAFSSPSTPRWHFDRETEFIISEAAETPAKKKLSKNEPLKENSSYLRHTLVEELSSSSSNLAEPTTQILKFHGSYQQDNRDNRAPGKEKDYSFFLRTRSPAGIMTAQLYLTLDELSDKYGNGTLRATTRETFQIHGIVKKNLKTVMTGIIKSLGSTLSACGDVNRNVTAPPAPYRNKPEYEYARQYAMYIADLLRPQTSSYADIWVDGEKYASLTAEDPMVTAVRNEDKGTGTNVDDPVEPLYGKTYLPRKFKVAVTVPGDNSVDIYTNDVGLVTITNAKGELEGFNVTVGGGMGRTHGKETTFPRVADHLGYVSKDDALFLVKSIMAVQRDFGNREDRRQSRMKYLVDKMGIDAFRAKVEEYAGFSMKPWRELEEFEFRDYLGWHEQGDGNLFYGVFIENGRIKNDGSFRIKDALREIVKKYGLSFVMTASQKAIFQDVKPEWKADIDSILHSHGVKDITEVDSLLRSSMACPALPLCGLATTEAERVLPDIIARIRGVMSKVGLSEDKSLVVRMTGCPNGCARPYMAELAFVGDGNKSYQLWVGGAPNQTRLAFPILDRVAESSIEQTLEPLFAYYTKQAKAGEAIGEFWSRVGKDGLLSFSAEYAAAS